MRKQQKQAQSDIIDNEYLTKCPPMAQNYEQLQKTR